MQINATLVIGFSIMAVAAIVLSNTVSFSLKVHSLDTKKGHFYDRSDAAQELPPPDSPRIVPNMVNPTLVLGFGIMAVAAIALSNTVSLKVHSLDTKKGTFLYRSDAAQELRNSFKEFPSEIAKIFYFFVITVTVIPLLAFMTKRYDANAVVSLLFIVVALLYSTIVVHRLSRNSYRVFELIQDPAHSVQAPEDDP